MKKGTFLLTGLLSLTVSCTESEVDIDVMKDVITAPDVTCTIDDRNTKTTLTTNEEGTGTVYWLPGDEINIFYGTTSTHYTSQNTTNTTSAVFKTTDIISPEATVSGQNWALYPYDSTATCDGSGVTTTIPNMQKAVAGTFDDELFTSIGRGAGTDFKFWNVNGGIKFTLSKSDIKSITFKGNNNEYIAGTVSLSFDENDRPMATVINGKKVITLTPKTGESFQNGTEYYIICLPCLLSKGFTISFNTDTETGKFRYSSAVSLKRSVFSKKTDIDTYASFIQKGLVDMGVSVYWADSNLSQSRYRWGDIVNSGRPFDWSHYSLCNGTSTSMTKYCTDASYGIKDDITTLLPVDDIAHTTLGDSWRIPTIEEWTELLNACSKFHNYYYSRLELTSYHTGEVLYLPETGYIHGNKVEAVAIGYYWSSSLYCSEPNHGAIFSFGEYSGEYLDRGLERCDGAAIRPVHEK